MPAAHAQSSANSISFQGALTGAGGQALANGNYSLTFKFYTNASTLFALATSNVPNVPVTGGLASTAIPVDAAWFNGQTRYLGIAINGGTELSPRVLVTAVPYAMTARYLNGPLIDLRVPSDPEGGFWSIQPDAFVGGDGYFGIVRYAPSADWGKSLVITPQGDVAIGTLFPHSKLEVNGNAEIIGKLKTKIIDLQVPTDPDSGFWSIQPDAFFPGQFGILRYQPTADPVRSLLIAPNGNVGIGVDQPRATLDVNGTTRTKVLQITRGADLAEHLSVSDAMPDDEFKVEPGMVVSIDPSGNRKFKLADEAYDRKRVGIISGGNGVKPGLILGDEGNPAVAGDQPIALTGQVWCHADATFGPITPGDLLTTSGTPGHAMKVSDDAKARFAVLGQALNGLTEGRGWVQVLVGKQ